MNAIRVLGVFTPSQLQSEVIEAEIKPHLPDCCRLERVSVRVPHARAQPAHPDNLEWHQDGGGPAGTVRHMVVWSTEQPTQIRLASGMVVTPKPYQLVWYDNDHVQHRQQAGTDETRRWFVSVRCSGENHLMQWARPLQISAPPSTQVPRGIAQHPVDGAYYLVVEDLAADGSKTIRNVRVCEECWQVMPRYYDFPNGLVSPDTDGDANGNGAKFKIAPYGENKEARYPLQRIVCLACYQKAFARVYPGAPLPDLNPAHRGACEVDQAQLEALRDPVAPVGPREEGFVSVGRFEADHR